MSAVHQAWKEREVKRATAAANASELWLARMRRCLALAVEAKTIGNPVLANMLCRRAALNLEQALHEEEAQ